MEDQIRLELLEARYAAALYALIDGNRDHLGRWHSWAASTRSIADNLIYIQIIRKGYFDNGHFTTAIFQADEMVGIAGFNAIAHWNRIGVLGYWLAEAARGQGIATRACRAYVVHAFRSLGLHRLEIHCAEANERSRKVAERVGFRLEGMLRDREWIGDRFVNHAIYGMYADDWSQVAR